MGGQQPAGKIHFPLLAMLTHIGLLTVWVYGGYCERVDRVYKPTNITGEPHLVLNIYWISNDVMMLPVTLWSWMLHFAMETTNHLKIYLLIIINNGDFM